MEIMVYEEQLWQHVQDETNNIRGEKKVMQRDHFNVFRRINFCVRASDKHFKQFL